MKKKYIIPSLECYYLKEEALLAGSGGDHDTDIDGEPVTPPDVNEDPDTPPPYIPGGPGGSV